MKGRIPAGRLLIAFAAGVLAGGVSAVVIAPAAVAAFIDPVPARSTFAAAPDWAAPSVTGSVVAKQAGGEPGAIRKGGGYYVYASVTDTGSPASGVAAVTADVSAITQGATAVDLAAGSFTVDGVTYSHRSALLTARSTLSAGAYSYSLSTTDAAGNAFTQSGYPLTVDNTAPVASSVQTANVAGGVVGRVEAGDTVTLTFSESVDPYSILAGWSGTSTPVMVFLSNQSPDRLTVLTWDDGIQLPLGTVRLGRSDYVTGDVFLAGSAMVQHGASITITLGTPVPSGSVRTAGGNGTMAWTPSATATDAAGNAVSTATGNESGPADKDF
jgi:hypothetical protein